MQGRLADVSSSCGGKGQARGHKINRITTAIIVKISLIIVIVMFTLLIVVMIRGKPSGAGEGPRI